MLQTKNHARPDRIVHRVVEEIDVPTATDNGVNAKTATLQAPRGFSGNTVASQLRNRRASKSLMVNHPSWRILCIKNLVT